MTLSCVARQTVTVPAGGHVELPTQNFAASAGSHLIHVRLYRGEQAFQGDFSLGVQSVPQPQPIVVSGPTIHHAGGYQIGDSPVSMQVTVAGNALPGLGEFQPVPLRMVEIRRHAPKIQKRLFRPTPAARIPPACPRLVLKWTRDGRDVWLRLHGGETHTIGRHGSNVFHLTTHPIDDPDQASEEHSHYQKISREHGQFQFLEDRLFYTDRSRAGTIFSGQSGTARRIHRQRVAIPHGAHLRISCVSLQFEHLEGGMASDEWPGYQQFAKVELDCDLTPVVGRTQAVRVRRLDGFRDSQCNYLMQRVLVIGRDPGTMIPIPCESLAPVHAKVLYLGGRFWLEPLQNSERYNTVVNDRRVPLDHLVPLYPSLMFQLGDREITVHEYTTK